MIWVKYKFKYLIILFDLSQLLIYYILINLIPFIFKLFKDIINIYQILLIKKINNILKYK